MKFIVTIFLILSLISSAFGNTEKLCSERKEYFSQQKMSLDRSFSESTLFQTDILLIGVEHQNYESTVYPQIIDSLIKLNYNPDCYLFELALDEEESLSFHLFNEGKPNWRDLKSRFGKDNLSLFQYLYSKDIKVFGIDVDIEEDDDIQWLNARDKIMAQNINSLLSTGKCKRSIFPIGAIHILSGYEGRLNLVENLNSLKKSSTKIGLSISGIRAPDHKNDFSIAPFWAMADQPLDIKLLNQLKLDNFFCREYPSLSGEISTLNSSDHHFPVYYDSLAKTMIGKINDTEFWIHYTCTTKQCQSLNNRILERFQNIGLKPYK